tara:strand:- start:1551 stop:1688 length:138 start_codon:yes stop_codon:yes gene_type:complete
MIKYIGLYLTQICKVIGIKYLKVNRIAGDFDENTKFNDIFAVEIF